MGASEDRATLREHERVIAASNVTEVMIPGYGIWTVDALKAVLEQREGALVLRDSDITEVASWALMSPNDRVSEQTLAKVMAADRARGRAT